MVKAKVKRKFMTDKKLKKSQRLRKLIRTKQEQISRLEIKRDYYINTLVRVLID